MFPYDRDTGREKVYQNWFHKRYSKLSTSVTRNRPTNVTQN